MKYKNVDGAILESISLEKTEFVHLEQLGVAHAKLRLRRAWPKSPDYIILEYISRDRKRIPGQWFRERRQLEAAYDLANALVELEVIALHGYALPGKVRAIATGLIEGYRPDPGFYDRLGVYVDAGRLRYVYLNIFRMDRQALVTRILDSVGQPFLWEG